jgi:signal transduction histidine kinase
MSNLNTKNKGIFRSNLFLSFKQKELNNEFNNNKYNNKKFLIFSSIFLVFMSLNTFASFYIQYLYPDFHLTTKQTAQNIFNIILAFLCFLAILIFYLRNMTNLRYIYGLISIIFTFLIHTFSIMCSGWATKVIGENYGVPAFSITFLSFLLFAYNIFMDNSHVLSTIERTFISIFFRVYEQNLAPTHYFDILGTLIYNVAFSIIIYFVERKDRTLFFSLRILEKENKIKNSLFNNLNLGIAVFNHKNLIEMNKLIKEIISSLIKSSTNRSDISETLIDILTNENFEKLLKKLLLCSFNLDLRFVNDLKTNFTFEDLYQYIEKNPLLFHEFVMIGHKIISHDEKYQIYVRYDFEFESVEFIFNNVSHISKIEEYQAKIKYRTIFLSKIAHEFKNPLISISELINQISSLLCKSSQGLNIVKLQNKINHIKYLYDYMMVMIKDFDVLSSCEANVEIKLFKEKFVLKDVIDFAFNIFKTRIKLNSKPIFLEKNFMKELPVMIISDELRLKQILINIISNSYKFTHQGKISISLEKIWEDQLQYILFKISDTGMGIPSEKLANLNKPFIKLNDACNKDGAGLGLGIVQDMVSRLGKDFKVSSKLNEGTCISFKILNEELQDNPYQIETYDTENAPFIINHEEPIESPHKIRNNRRNSNNKSHLSNTLSFNENFLINNKEGLIYDNSSINRNSNKNSSISIRKGKKDTIINITSCPLEIHRLTLNINQQQSIFNQNNINSNVKLAKFSKEEDHTTINMVELNNCKMFRVLLVDDEKLILNSSERIFEQVLYKNKENFSISKCYDGADCINTIYEGLKKGIRYDAICSDGNMNFIDGCLLFDSLRILMEAKKLYLTKLFLISADESEAERKSIDRYYSKPLSLRNVEEIYKICKVNVL